MMQAGNPDASSIKINFGERQPTPTPIDLSVTVDFFSPEYDHLRNDFNNRYQGVNLPKTALAFEFQIAENIQEKAEELTKLIIDLKKMLDQEQQEKIKMNIYQRQDRILLTVESKELLESVEGIESKLEGLKEKSKENNQINLRVSSHNDGLNIWHSISEIGAPAALFSSLHLQFDFIKTDTITQFLQIVLSEQLGIDKFNNMLKSFKKLNVELNMASGAYLNEFPKVLMIKQPPNKPQANPVADFLMSSNIEKARFYVINPTLLLKGNLNADGFIAVLKMLHGK